MKWVIALNWKRTLAVIAAITVTVGTISFRDTVLQRDLVYAKTISEIEAEKKEHQEKIQQKKAEADALAKDISRQEEYQKALQDEIDLINSKMYLIDTQIQSISAEMEEKQAQITELESMIAVQQAETEKGLEDFKARIRTLYVHGNDSLLSALVGATDFYDVLAKVDLIKRIGKHDDEMMHSLQRELRALSENQTELNSQVQTLSLRQTEMQSVRSEFADSRSELDNAVAEVMVLQAKLAAQQSDAQQDIRRAEEAMEDLEEEEEALILEAAKKAAEDAKKKADEEAKKKAEEVARQKALEEEARRQSEEASRRRTTTTTTATTTRATTATTARTTVTTAVSAPGATTYFTTKLTTTTKAATTKATSTTVMTLSTTSTTTTTTTTTAPPAPSGVLAWPAPGFYHISSPFGWRWGRMHKGIDIAGGGQNINGANACAAKGGTVIKAKLGYNGGYGNYVQIDHGDGLNTLYAHLQSLDVSVGQQVSTGTVVGKIGSTGNSTGPHLHFSVIVNGTFVDPMGYLY